MLTLEIYDPEKYVVGFDAGASRLDAWQDDKETDLLVPILGDTVLHAAAGGAIGPSNFRAVSGVIESDHHTCTVQLYTPHVPAQGATRLRVQGSVVYRYGFDEKTVEKEVDLKTGGTLKLGSVEASIGETAEQQRLMGGDRTVVSITTERSQDVFKDVVFLRPDGKPLAMQLAGSSSRSRGREVTMTKHYATTEKIERLRVRITYFSAVASLKIPVSMETGLGF